MPLTLTGSFFCRYLELSVYGVGLADICLAFLCRWK